MSEKKKPISYWNSQYGKNKELRKSLRQYRVMQIEKLLIEGKYEGKVTKDVLSTQWDISERQVDKYFNEAYSNITKFIRTDKNYEKALIVTRLESLYRDNKEKENLSECRLLMKEKGMLLGLYEPVKLEVDTNQKPGNTYLVEKYYSIIEKTQKEHDERRKNSNNWTFERKQND